MFYNYIPNPRRIQTHMTPNLVQCTIPATEVVRQQAMIGRLKVGHFVNSLVETKRIVHYKDLRLRKFSEDLLVDWFYGVKINKVHIQILACFKYIDQNRTRGHHRHV